MMSRRTSFLCLAILAGTLLTGSAAVGGITTRAALPDRLTDAAFWSLVGDISEPGGSFRIADNFTSNEPEVALISGMLRERRVQGGVYLGVGPEQNFTYIAAIRPAMAFIVDIRRQAVMQHLLFKAAFELAADRADFISLVFAKPRPDGVDTTTPIQRLWEMFAAVGTDQRLVTKNHKTLFDQLKVTHHFAFTPDEEAQLEWVFQAFVTHGPAISTRGAPGGRGGGNGTTFADLTGWSLDAAGQPQSFLATDEQFRTVKALHERNLIVPVSGDFGGTKALRRIAAYLKAQGGVVSAFYLSNVEQYLFQDGKEGAFYDNVAALPTTTSSVFIRPYSLRRGTSAPQPLCPIAAFIQAVGDGRVKSNNDALGCAASLN
ncbi:MAG: hypothetical protein ABI051_11495 [Vicinamibacterales bacterium]